MVEIQKKAKIVKSRLTDLSDKDAQLKDLCCCPPRALVWIETNTTNIFVENKIDVKRNLQVRSDAAATINDLTKKDIAGDGGAGSHLEETELKAQGKIYRTDTYTINPATQ